MTKKGIYSKGQGADAAGYSNRKSHYYSGLIPCIMRGEKIKSEQKKRTIEDDFMSSDLSKSLQEAYLSRKVWKSGWMF
jgi:hypothetical protein